MFTSLTLDQIQSSYPDQWVLLGNPVRNGAALIGGVVICHGSEKRDLLLDGLDWRNDFETATAIFTGTKPKGRRFLL